MALLDTTAEGVIGMRARGNDMQQRPQVRPEHWADAPPTDSL